MKIISTAQDLQTKLHSTRLNNNTIGFVPTMGALHEGHLSLIARAKEHCDVVVCSVFVNPSQFNEASDLKNYPRTLESDAQKLISVACDILFVPDEKEVYPIGHQAEKIEYKGLDKVMEGAMRPGHFDGVVEVVYRLFEMVQPHMACFGEKDFQQLAIVRQLVEQKNLNIRIIPCPIVREENGLAQSSRNKRLSPEQRAQAAILYETLVAVRELVPLLNPDEVEEHGRSALTDLDFCELEYFEVAESESLKPIFRWHECQSARAFVVARFGEVRLIDNLEIYRAEQDK